MMEDEQDLPNGPADFFRMLLGSAIDARKRLDEVVDKVSSPAVNVRLPVALIARLVDSVGCECDMCIGTLMWAKSIDTSKLDEQLRRLIELSIASAEIRLLAEKQKEEYRKIYGHRAQ